VENVPRRRVVLLVLCVMALFFFFRTPGAEAVRWVQILLLFVAGVLAGLALALFRTARTG
jgi:EamA domain-containing membrane protein RarD